jgi:hypothetical protein
MDFRWDKKIFISDLFRILELVHSKNRSDDVGIGGGGETRVDYTDPAIKRNDG